MELAGNQRRTVCDSEDAGHSPRGSISVGVRSLTVETPWTPGAQEGERTRICIKYCTRLPFSNEAKCRVRHEASTSILCQRARISAALKPNQLCVRLWLDFSGF